MKRIVLIIHYLQNKRLPSANGPKRVTRDHRVEIDLTGKELTDEGFDIVVDELIKCINYRDETYPNGTFRLTELALSGNKLTVASMFKMGIVVRLNHDSLSHLDISENDISVINEADRTTWKFFLVAFQNCCMLRRIDFGGNELGCAGFDVLAQVYAQNRCDFAKVTEDGNSQGDWNLAKIKILDDVFGTLAPNGKADEPESTRKLDHRVLIDNQSAYEDTSLMALSHNSIRGLRAVPYLTFSNSALGDAHVFHLFNMVMAHDEPETLLKYLSSEKSLTPLNIGEKNGVVYSPQKQITPRGEELLKLGCAYRRLTLEENAEEEKEAKLDKDRKELQGKILRWKKRLLLNVLNTEGVHSVKLWGVALRMMAAARAILLDSSKRPGLKVEEKVLPASEIDGFDFVFPASKDTIREKKSGNTRTSRTRTTNEQCEKHSYRAYWRFGLPLNIWQIIIAYAIDDSDLLDYQQQAQIIEYSCDWQMIEQELRLKGGTEEEQIWKVLSSMDCLTYAVL